MDINKIERAFKSTVDSALQQSVVEYLEALFRKSLSTMLDNPEPTVVGELRILKKLIEVFKKDKVNYD